LQITDFQKIFPKLKKVKVIYKPPQRTDIEALLMLYRLEKTRSLVTSVEELSFQSCTTSTSGFRTRNAFHDFVMEAKSNYEHRGSITLPELDVAILVRVWKSEFFKEAREQENHMRRDHM
jgi:hypothetical protein